MTTAGSIIGTIQYMSPEQIEGKEADPRSDIFAFGAVLYEMAAGKRPFQGKSQISLASAILESEPEPVSVLKPSTPPAFEHVVSTCLRKNPEERFQSAQDIKLELQWVAEKAADKPSLAAAAPSTPGKRLFGWIAAVIAGLVLGAVGATFLHQQQPAPSVRTVINPPGKTHINLAGDNAGPPVVSPDGSMIAFAAAGADGKNTIWVRPTNSLDAHQLSDTDGAIFPFWSFDSRSIAFFAEGKLKVVEISGGSAQLIADAPFGRGGARMATSSSLPLHRTGSTASASMVALPLRSPLLTLPSTHPTAGLFFFPMASISCISPSTTIPRSRQMTRFTMHRSMAA
jgi:hypothetical protein